MEKVRGLISNNRYCHALVTTLTAGIMFVAFWVLCDIAPFGGNSWLIYDMNMQYADFLAYYRTLISGENNIFYSLAMTMGSSSFGFFTYYLSSPFLLFFLFINNAGISVAVTALIGIKISLMAGSCDLFLSEYIKGELGDLKKSYNTLVFAISYAFCAFMISNSINIIWLDTFILFPIFMLMLDRLLSEGRKIGYVIALALVLYSNYYIAFFICIFAVIWFIYRIVLDSTNLGRKVRDFILMSLWAAGIDTVILLPTLLELFGGPKDIFQLGLKATKGNLTVREILSKLWFYAYDQFQEMSGTPLIYSGILLLILFGLYFFNKKVSVKEKVCVFAITLIFVLSFAFDKINLIWHAGMEPSGYPYREAIFMVFICIVCGCKSFNLFEEGIKRIHIILVVVIMEVIMVYSLSGDYYYANNRMMLINGILIAGIGLLMLLRKGKMAQYICILLVLIQIAELGMNAVFVYRSQISLGVPADADFRGFVSTTGNTVKCIENDKSLYRMENMFPRSRNDAMMYGYNGITHYSSSGMLSTRMYLQKMGFNDMGLYTSYGFNNTCLADSLLGIKYLMGAEKYRRDYKVITSDGNGIYENPYKMSIAYFIDEKSDINDENPFVVQERMYSDITGEEVTMFEDVIASINYETGDGNRTADIQCLPANDGYVYLYLDGIQDKIQSMSIYVDGEFVCVYGNLSNNAIVNLGYHEKDEQFSVTIDCESAEGDFGDILIKTERVDRLSEYSTKVAGNNLEIQKISSSKYGIDASKVDESHYGIAISIPYADGWKAYLGGKKVNIEKMYDTFMCIPLTELGSIDENSQIIIKYTPPGLYLGALISLAAFAGLLLLYVYRRNKKSMV